MKWNCIVTCPRHMEEDAIAEAISVLKEMGDISPEARPAGISGIILVRTGCYPVDFSHYTRHAVTEIPWRIRYIRRIIPAHIVVPNDIESILGAVEKLLSRIAPEDTYRVSIEKRNTQVSGKEIIASIASTIPNKVSLEHPDVVVQVEILGGVAGISVLRPDDIFSLDITKRAISD